MLPYLLRVAKKEIEKISVFGNDYQTPDGTCIRDYIHIEDLAEAHLRSFEWLLEKKQKSEDEVSFFEVFNIGTGAGTSVLEMIMMTQQIIGDEINYEIVDRRDWDVAISVANASKAKQILWWEAKKSILEGIQDAWNFVNKEE